MQEVYIGQVSTGDGLKQLYEIDHEFLFEKIVQDMYYLLI